MLPLIILFPDAHLTENVLFHGLPFKMLLEASPQHLAKGNIC